MARNVMQNMGILHLIVITRYLKGFSTSDYRCTSNASHFRTRHAQAGASVWPQQALRLFLERLRGLCLCHDGFHRSWTWLDQGCERLIHLLLLCHGTEQYRHDSARIPGSQLGS